MYGSYVADHLVQLLFVGFFEFKAQSIIDGQYKSKVKVKSISQGSTIITKLVLQGYRPFECGFIPVTFESQKSWRRIYLFYKLNIRLLLCWSSGTYSLQITDCLLPGRLCFWVTPPRRWNTASSEKTISSHKVGAAFWGNQRTTRKKTNIFLLFAFQCDAVMKFIELEA